MKGKLGFLSLTFLIISAVDSNRTLPSAALFGSSMIFYFIFSAIFFLFPTALVSAELASTFPEKEGVFHWVRHAFGEKWGMMAIWLQWVNTVVWFPTILSFIAGSLAFIFDPSLINNKLYMICAIILIFWGLTFINLRGIKASVRIDTFLVLIGTLLPIIFLILLGAIWVHRDHSLQISFSSIMPQMGKFETGAALIAITGSFLGMELSGIHVRHVHSPQKKFPRALFFASSTILITMLLGALTIAAVIPVDEINLAGGIMQVFNHFFHLYHLDFLTPIISILIVLGSIGGLILWMISPSKGLLFAAKERFLPSYFTHLNRYGVESRVLLTQAMVVTILSALLLFVPTVNAFYWFLTALSTGLYMLMYLLMFFAALRLRKKKREKRAGEFMIPGKMAGLWIVCILGIIGSFLTFFFGFIPPTTVNLGSAFQYALMIGIGNVIFILPVLFMIHYRRKKTS